MGGYGSGRRGGKDTVSQMRALDVRKLKRDGCLEPGFSGQSTWSRGGTVIATIRFRVGQEASGLMYVQLMYRSRDRSEVWQDMDYRVALDRTPCNYGGSRVWFRCPSCHRRVAVIYGGKVFACRHCHRLAYDCQHERRDDRESRQVDKLRDRLKWEPGLLNGKQWKPKWMRWRTYHRLEAEYDERMRRLLRLMRGRFGRDVDAFL